MIRRLARWRSLQAADRFVVVGAFFGLLLVAVLIACLGVFRTRRLMEWSTRGIPFRPVQEQDIDDARRLSDLIGYAGRSGIVALGCLPQSLLLHRRLRARGLDSSLRIGVRRDASGFAAHAWVELDGIALGQSQLDHLPFREKGYA